MGERCRELQRHGSWQLILQDLQLWLVTSCRRWIADSGLKPCFNLQEKKLWIICFCLWLFLIWVVSCILRTVGEQRAEWCFRSRSSPRATDAHLSFHGGPDLKRTSNQQLLKGEEEATALCSLTRCCVVPHTACRLQVPLCKLKSNFLWGWFKACV